jgi:cell wall-associated NlpC family hydrolase
MMTSKSMMQILIRWCLLMGLAVFMNVGCASTPPPPPSPMTASPVDDKTPLPRAPHPEVPTAPADEFALIEQKIRSEVRQWQGTPHRMGGTNRHGIDCSGFVQRLYHDIFDRQIPRTTALQSELGRWIGKAELRTGDLVFFKMPYKGRHVGIYLGTMEFAHASTSEGVTISSLEAPHWRQSYWTARRCLNTAN